MRSIALRDIVDECFQDYHLASMLLATTKCNWKCLVEQGLSTSLCQNMPLCDNPIREIPFESILKRYRSNPITKAIVIGGLEPLLQFDEVIGLIQYLRENGVEDDIVIYTGYNKAEVEPQIAALSQFKNIVMKFGRFVPDDIPHFDDVLKITLISSNQYAERIS